jgi:hypothetical protein
VVSLFDFVDIQRMLRHEPGLTYAVVGRYQLLLLPGTFFFSPSPAILLNRSLAALVGTIMFFIAARRS